MRSLSRFFADASGVSAIEFALLSPVITMMFGLAVDGGLAINGQMAIEAASRAGADYAAIHGAAATDGIVAAASGSTNWPVTVSTQTYCGCAGGAGVVQQSCSSGICSNGAQLGNYLSVTATANYSPMFADFWGALVSNGGMLSHTTVARVS